MTAPVGGDRPPAAGEEAAAPRAEVIVRVAAATEARGDVAMAVSLYRRAHALDRRNVSAAVGLARTLARLGAYDEAADAYRAALRLAPKSPEALRGLGNVLIVLRQPAAALRQFDLALRKSDDPRLYNGLGVASDMLGRHEAAQDYYRKGLERSPDSMELAGNLGLSFLLSGRPDRAVRTLRRVAGATGATVRQRLNLALALVFAGESDAAGEIVRADLDPAAAQAQIAWFESLRALSDPAALREAIGAHLTGAGHGS